MRRLIAAAAAGVTLLLLGYAASGIGSAGPTRAAQSSTGTTGSTTGTTGTTGTTVTTSTTLTTSTTSTTLTTTTTPAPKKVAICHRTKSKKHPYVRIVVAGSALAAHMRHKGDIIPAPAAGCPSRVVLVRNHHIVKKKKHH